MPTLVVMHEVEDFNKWKPGFDSGIEMRKANGFTNETVYQDNENPNKVTLVTDVADVEKAKAILTSPELVASMKAAGVKGNPELTWLNKVG